jgi:hypothetical protein
MSDAAEVMRCFKVRARHVDSHHSRLLEEASFEAAAIAYMEHFDLTIPIDDDQEISVIVQDVWTGHECCFRCGLDSGDITPCG